MTQSSQLNTPPEARIGCRPLSVKLCKKILQEPAVVILVFVQTLVPRCEALYLGCALEGMVHQIQEHNMHFRKDLMKQQNMSQTLLLEPLCGSQAGLRC
jgi:hypothetical protein